MVDVTLPGDILESDQFSVMFVEADSAPRRWTSLLQLVSSALDEECHLQALKRILETR